MGKPGQLAGELFSAPRKSFPNALREIGRKPPQSSNAATVYGTALTVYRLNMPLLEMSRIALIALLAAPHLTGCAVFFGQVTPAEQKAAPEQPLKGAPALATPWKRLAAPASDTGDVSYQNEQTGSTLSFTSGCRPSFANRSSPDEEEKALKQISRSMSGGLTRIQRRHQHTTLLDGNKALQSRIEGTVQGRKVIIVSTVARKASCVYDVTLVSVSRFFDADFSTYSDWSSKIRLP